MSPQFDSTIHISDLILFGGGIIAFFKVWMALRDTVRDNSRDISRIDKTVTEHGYKLEHHDQALARLGFTKLPHRDAEV
jgi:hypothetical protein